MRRALLKALAGVVAMAAIAAAAAYLHVRRSLPLVDGEISVAGLTGPIDIVRDADAVPHIFARTKHDALYGLGYAHAQDRLWQMEFQRRIGHGRLSEIFGAVTVPQDRFLRTVGFGRAARSAWDHLPQTARRQIDAYVAGVNAFLSSGPSLPPEFALLRFQPESWTGPDVLVWIKMMAWDLSANYSFELLRHDLLARVGPERMAELLPPDPENGLSILGNGKTDVAQETATHVAQDFSPAHASTSNRLRQGYGGPPKLQAKAEDLRYQYDSGAAWSSAFADGLARGNPAVRGLLLGGASTEAIGSNSWVVDGTLTTTGKPMLANDPHLGAQVPSLWYLAHMSAGDFDVIGATLPGVPAVAIGRNRFIAWGETNVAADVEDFYRERLDASGRFAEFRGLLEPLGVMTETVDVKGGAPVRVDVRISRHGPILSDAINANNAESDADRARPPLEPLAFRWTALDEEDNTVGAFLLLNEARNWGEFTAALREIVVPSQNFLYADVSGHIGYYAPGRIPVRARGDGSSPADGWSGQMEWIGWVPFDELPHAYDPPEHFIVTANNRPMPATYSHLIALEYPNPYRAQRVTDLIRQKNKLAVVDFRAMQADTVSLHAQTLLPLLLQHVKPETAADRQAVEIVSRWDFDASADSAAAAVFQAWFLRLARALAGDELGPLVTEEYETRFSHITRFVTQTLSAPRSAWCDVVGTERRESCEESVTGALHSGVVDLTRRLGGDMARWRWAGVHRAMFPHQGLDAVALLRPLLSRSMPSAGDWSTVNVGAVAADEPFEQHEIPSYRQIIDLSPANDSYFIDAVGQSGHFLSKHYDDFLIDWQQVRHRRMRMTPTDVENGALGHLRLTPDKQQ